MIQNIFRFRVFATNEVGDSEATETSNVFIKEVLESPSILLEGYMKPKVVFRTGQTLRLVARVNGQPEPNIEWKVDGDSVNDDKYIITRLVNHHLLCKLLATVNLILEPLLEQNYRLKMLHVATAACISFMQITKQEKSLQKSMSLFLVSAFLIFGITLSKPYI